MVIKIENTLAFAVVVLLTTIGCSSVQKSTNVELWELIVAQELEKEIKKSEVRCGEAHEGDKETWLSELKRHKLKSQFSLVDSLILHSSSSEFIIVHSVYYGYDEDWLPNTYCFDLGEPISAYIIDQSTVMPYEKKPVDLLSYFETLNSGCDYNLYVVTELSANLTISKVKVFINVDRQNKLKSYKVI